MSGREGAVYVVGGVLGSGGLADDLWSFDVASGTWSALGFHGPAPAKVLAATYRPGDRCLYVIDEVVEIVQHIPLRAARLLRISLDDLQSTLIYQGARHPLVDVVFLTNGPEGELLVMSARADGWAYRGLLLQVTEGGQLVAEKTVHGAGQIAFEPTLSTAGLTIPILTQGTVEGRFLAGFPSSNEQFTLGDLL